METEVLILKIIAIIVLTILAMWLIRKLVESFFNIQTLFKASKDRNHPSRVASSGVVLNKKTRKLENCGDKVILPFKS